MTEARSVRSKSEDPATPPSLTGTKSSFLAMNERAVEDMTLNYFYKPHTITALFGSIFAAMYFAFIRQVPSDRFFIDFLQVHRLFRCIILAVHWLKSTRFMVHVRDEKAPTLIARLCSTYARKWKPLILSVITADDFFFLFLETRRKSKTTSGRESSA